MCCKASPWLEELLTTQPVVESVGNQERRNSEQHESWIQFFIVSISAPAEGKDEKLNLQELDSGGKNLVENTPHLLLIQLKNSGD